MLRSLSPDTLRRMTPDDIETLKALGVRIAQLLEDRSKLVGGTSDEIQS
jgi:hypothetical protein